MAAQMIYDRLLQDQELRPHLEKGEALLFIGLGRDWQRIERQVERLGFGELYVISQRGSRLASTRVSPLGVG